MSILKTYGNDDGATIVQGKGLYLRHPSVGDYQEWARLRDDSREHLTPWEPTWPIDDLTKPAYRRRLRRYNRDIKDATAYPFFSFRSSDDALVGSCIISNIRRGVTQTCSLGYWVGQKYAGQGWMTESVHALVPFIFEELKLHRIEAACLPNNEGSKRVLEKVGFTKEGFARQYLKINGEWQDHILFAMLDSDPRL